MISRRQQQNINPLSQSSAINALLDCSSTFKAKERFSFNNEEENICPWAHSNKKYIHLQNKRHKFTKTCSIIRTPAKKQKQNKQRKNSTTFSKTIRNVDMFSSTMTRYDLQKNKTPLASKVVNLSKQLQRVHNRKKCTYILKQKYNRLKTTV